MANTTFIYFDPWLRLMVMGGNTYITDLISPVPDTLI